MATGYFRSNENAARELVRELGHSKSIAVGGDLSDEAQVESCFERLGEKFGRVDILIANAGAYGYVMSSRYNLRDTPEEIAI